MADTAHRITDKKLEEMEKRLSAIYSRANKEIGERWKEYLTESHAEIDELQKSYELAKKSVDPKEIRKSGKKLANAKRERTLMKWVAPTFVCATEEDTPVTLHHVFGEKGKSNP